jgi:adenylate cyclase class IV
MRQIDTYFAVPRGRLKLRQIAGPGEVGSAELIGYARPDVAGARWSAYDLVPVAPDDVPALKRALAATVGIRAVVTKEREVGVLRRTRVHLDNVEGLGCFVELETVVAAGDDEAGAAGELADVAALLGLEGLEPIAGSYAELAGDPV